MPSSEARQPSAWGEFGDGHDYSRTGKHDPNNCRECLRQVFATERAAREAAEQCHTETAGGFHVYQQLAEERESMLRAEIKALSSRLRAVEAALRLIARGCENYTSGNCRRVNRYRDAPYSANRWCDPCIAQWALSGDAETTTKGVSDEPSI